MIRSGSDAAAVASSGGFSLRRVSSIRRVLAFQSRDNDTVSDAEFFSYRMHTFPDAVLPTAQMASRFSVEHTYHNNSMGFHIGDIDVNNDVWAQEEQRREIYKYCPEVKMVMSPMKLLREKCEG